MVWNGVDIPPYYRVLPPPARAVPNTMPNGQTRLCIESGAGFGVGTHETTQLCLLALGQWQRSGFHPRRVLDFGAGSGILSVAAALAGARVEAVEIEPAAVENAKANMRHNEVENLVTISQTMSEPSEPFDLVFANILVGVLVPFAPALCSRVAPQGRLVLSGLVATDIPKILATYKPLLPAMRAEVYSRGDWRAVTFM